MAIDISYAEQIQEMDNIHIVHLLKRVGDTTSFIAKYQANLIPDEDEILKIFGSGYYLLKVIYFVDEDDEKKRRSKQFKVGLIGDGQQGQLFEEGDLVESGTNKVLESLAESIKQNNELLKMMIQNSQSQTAPQNINELLLTKLMDSSKDQFKTFSEGIKVAQILTPPAEEKESFNFSSLGEMIKGFISGNDSNSESNSSGASPLDLED